MDRISPMILLLIVILAIVFFVFGIVHLLVRCLLKNRLFTSASQPDRSPDAFHFQRQLQQLFWMHDSGLDQAIVEALPVFCYNEINGLNQPFDCAVCLCEFSDGDRLKLLVNCSHAFHILCIETWLLSNSTCPLCRCHIGTETHTEKQHPECPNNWSPSVPIHRPAHPTPANIFPIRLGKFRSLKDGMDSKDTDQNVSSCSALDARRCYSMGAFQYIISDADLQVAFSSQNEDVMKFKTRYKNEQLVKNRDSLSISKIWLWRKKCDLSSSLDTNDCTNLPMSGASNIV